ncbi:hypothetical protein RND71_001417 [Anisodus tanguticus]|uniref:Uncharacterized protein n=1 Tax=Anisodus tanguticus TaxID=243964 RepID=A0AAE1VYG9_9SOLA|nr:hypothetical protein RND71_001417 [Anisodus tanguticus]
MGTVFDEKDFLECCGSTKFARRWYQLAPFPLTKMPSMLPEIYGGARESSQQLWPLLLILRYRYFDLKIYAFKKSMSQMQNIEFNMSNQTTGLENIFPAGNSTTNTKLNNEDGWHIPNNALWGVLGFVVLGLLYYILDRVTRRKSSKNNEANHSDEAKKNSDDAKESDDATSKILRRVWNADRPEQTGRRGGWKG